MTETSAYSRLEAIFRKAATIGEALSVLHWDMAAMMPDGGAEARAEQLAALKGIVHETITAPEVADLLAAAEAEPTDPWESANLREMRRDWVHASSLPADLVAAKTNTRHQHHRDHAVETFFRRISMHDRERP